MIVRHSYPGVILVKCFINHSCIKYLLEHVDKGKRPSHRLFSARSCIEMYIKQTVRSPMGYWRTRYLNETFTELV